MKKITTLIVSLAVGMTAAVSFAQAPAEGAPKGGEGKHRPMMRDCSKIADADKKAQCETRQAAMKAAMEKCKDLKGEEHHKCMQDALPKKDK
jgi:hypothetical protein